MRIVAMFLATLAVACQPPPIDEPPEPLPAAPTVQVPTARPAATASPSTTPSGEPQKLADDEELREGRVELVGVVRPTKGGLSVRGVTLALETIHDHLPPKDRQLGYDELLGVKLRVVADLEKRSSASPSPGEPAIQTRGGTWFAALEVHAVSIVAPAVVIEGEVSRSKGLLNVGDHLVTRDDLGWSLKGADPMGKRVRLWGQPRTYHCKPPEQCLVGGSIPMFDVARAELLP